jgi:hypothetical protein
MSKGKNEDTWVMCPVCKTKLKKENLSVHLKHVHDKKIKDFDESSVKVLPKKGQKQKKPMGFSIKSVAVIFVVIIVAVAVVFFVLSGSLDDSNNDNMNNNGSSDNSNWLENYSPVRSLGSGDNNFWIDHPIDGPITHPNWMIDSLEGGCVFFVVHKHTCTWCDPQAQRVIKLAEKYKNMNLVFYDLDLDLGGDIMTKGQEALTYDPNGPPHYIALTGIFTLIEKDGEVKYAWHAWEGDMTESEIESWMKDAMYYHHINEGNI